MIIFLPLQMLQRPRDEAHRFAITFQRQSREKSLQIFASIADVPGVGPRTRLELFRKFRTIEALKAAPEAEVVELSFSVMLTAAAAS